MSADMHDDPELAAVMKAASEVIEVKLMGAAQRGALFVGFATLTGGGIRVSSYGGSNASVARMGLLQALLDFMLTDATSSPALLTQCRRLADVLDLDVGADGLRPRVAS